MIHGPPQDDDEQDDDEDPNKPAVEVQDLCSQSPASSREALTLRPLRREVDPLRRSCLSGTGLEPPDRDNVNEIRVPAGPVLLACDTRLRAWLVFK